MAGLNLLVTGKPGVGKTTLVERVLAQIRGTLRVAGFTTAEVRDASGTRSGFAIRTIAGAQGELARSGLASRVRVGRYGIHVATFERLALPELARHDVDLLVIDEIGRMECTSARFRRAVEEALDAEISVLATLGIGHLPFMQAVRARPDVELLTLTERNRDALVAEVCAGLQKAAG